MLFTTFQQQPVQIVNNSNSNNSNNFGNSLLRRSPSLTLQVSQQQSGVHQPVLQQTAGGRRPFTVEEDARLLDIMTKLQFVNWEQVAAHMGDRTSRQCRERWVNYLNPAIRTDPWNESEDTLLLEKVNELGRCWSSIGKFFNGRSENDVKNRWYSHLRYRTIENDEGKFKFVEDPSESPFPERKKRHRVKISPQQNAIRMLEQQRTRQQSHQQQQTFQHQFNQQQMAIQMPIFARTQQFSVIEPRNTAATTTTATTANQTLPHYLASQFSQPQLQTQQFQLPQVVQIKKEIQFPFTEESVQKPQQMEQVEMKREMIEQDSFEQNLEQEPQVMVEQDNCIPEPEYVDFWDQNLFDEATTEYSFMGSAFTGFSLY